MSERESTSTCLGALSDGVFAIAIAVLVLGIKPSHSTSNTGLLAFWPRGLAMIFVLAKVTYVTLCSEAADRLPSEEVSPRISTMMRMRSVAAQLTSPVAAFLALAWPIISRRRGVD